MLLSASNSTGGCVPRAHAAERGRPPGRCARLADPLAAAGARAHCSARRCAACRAGLLVQGKDAGAWPAVRAVLGPEAAGGQLWGPRVFGLRGRPRAEPLWENLEDAAVAARLWAESVTLTGLEPSA